MGSPQLVEQELGGSNALRAEAAVSAGGVALFGNLLKNAPNGGVRLADSGVSVSTAGALPQLNSKQLVKEAHQEQREYAARHQQENADASKKKMSQLAAHVPITRQGERLKAELKTVEQDHPGAVEEVERKLEKAGHTPAKPKPKPIETVELSKRCV